MNVHICIYVYVYTYNLISFYHINEFILVSTHNMLVSVFYMNRISVYFIYQPQEGYDAIGKEQKRSTEQSMGDSVINIYLPNNLHMQWSMF